jgi:hypothetical protein
VLTAAWACEPDKHSDYRVGVSETYYTPHGYAVKDEIICEFVAKWGLLSIYESGAYGARTQNQSGILLSESGQPVRKRRELKRRRAKGPLVGRFS